jgi:hypothetical protein
MTNASAASQSVNPSIDDVVQWLEAKASCGDLAASTTRLQVTALHSFAACVADGEPKNDATYVQDNLDRLADRWSRLNPESKADTAKSYLSRARSALSMYFAWKENPSGFRFERRPTTKKEGAPAKKQDRPAHPPDSLFQLDEQQTPPKAPTPTFNHRFKVGPDKYVFFELPEDGLTVAEWRKWVAHTYTLCDDFDPEAPSPIVSQSIIRG